MRAPLDHGLQLLGRALCALGLTTAFVACGVGGVGDCDPAPDVELYFSVLEEGKAGRTLWGCSRGTDIQIDPGVPSSTVQRVIEHEMGHAKGVDHIHDESCVMRSPPILGRGFCDAELDGARAFGRVSRIEVRDEDLLEATRDAIDHWNEAAGETLFELR